jgi:hypothetical protein
MATKASRISERAFPDVPRLSTKAGMFSPLPWVFRSVLAAFPPRTWMAYTYIIMKSGPEGISWPTDKQMAHDLGIGVRKVGPHLKLLVELGFIVMREVDGLRYICLVDPVVALEKLAEERSMSPEMVASMREDLDLMRPKRATKVVLPTLSQEHVLPSAAFRTFKNPEFLSGSSFAVPVVATAVAAAAARADGTTGFSMSLPVTDRVTLALPEDDRDEKAAG